MIVRMLSAVLAVLLVVLALLENDRRNLKLDLRHLESEKAQIEQARRASEQARLELTRQLQARDEILAAREKEAAKIAAGISQIKKRLQEAYDVEPQECDDAPVPGPVSGVLRAYSDGHGAGGSSSDAAPGADGANPDPGVGR